MSARAGASGRAADVATLVAIGAITIALIALGWLSLAREFYSASAFVERYLSLLSDGRAADALLVPGVRADAQTLEAAGLPVGASDALLRQSALGSITEVRRVSETTEGAVTAVTVSYRAGGVRGESTFAVERDGQIGLAPTWRFASSPLSAIALDLRGSTAFEVNQFSLDTRQVRATDADATAPAPMLVFTPGIYRVRVETALATAKGVSVLADTPLAEVPLTVTSIPTPAFTEVVRTKVDGFLDDCASQRVLQPTGCPFGLEVRNRIVNEPSWSITAHPEVVLEPSGADWVMQPAPATAHISVDIRSIYDGSVTTVERDVPFTVDARVQVLSPDNVSIVVGSAEELGDDG